MLEIMGAVAREQRRKRKGSTHRLRTSAASVSQGIYSRASGQGICSRASVPGHLSRQLAEHAQRCQPTAASGLASLELAAAIAADASAGILAGSKSDVDNFADRSAGLPAVSDKSLTDAAIAVRCSFMSAIFSPPFLDFSGIRKK